MMSIAMTKQQMKAVSTGAVVIGLVLLPGLASFVQQQLLQRKMMKLNLAQAAPKGDQENSKYAKLTFDKLKSWTYVEGKTPLPAFIKALDGKDVEMVGFMMPLTEVKDVTEFLLVPYLWGCCYGEPPAVNHIVVVKMPKGQTTKVFNDTIRVRGRFNAGETKQDGYLVSLYVLTADQIEAQ
jgi:hypothetical protein